MKNLIILIAFILIQQAFATDKASLQKTSKDQLFTNIYKVICTEGINCDAKNIFAITEQRILAAIDRSGSQIEEHDLILNPTDSEILDLIELDFSGAHGDTSLSRDQINRVMSIVYQSNTETAIMGVVTPYGVTEYLFIYSHISKKLFILKRSQFNKLITDY